MIEIIFRMLEEITSEWNKDDEWWFVELYKPNFGWMLPVAVATIGSTWNLSIGFKTD